MFRIVQVWTFDFNKQIAIPANILFILKINNFFLFNNIDKKIFLSLIDLLRKKNFEFEREIKLISRIDREEINNLKANKLNFFIYSVS